MATPRSRYAERTTVSPERTRASIERLLVRYGADRFAYGWEQGRATIAFSIGGRLVRFAITLPVAADAGLTPSGRRRTGAALATALAQAERQRWRALELVVHAKLEAVAAGVSTLEDEFLAWTVLPDGSTVGERIQAQIEASYGSGAMPALLGAPNDDGPRGVSPRPALTD